MWNTITVDADKTVNFVLLHQIDHFKFQIEIKSFSTMNDCELELGQNKLESAALPIGLAANV
jgi:hypothetical protein